MNLLDSTRLANCASILGRYDRALDIGTRDGAFLSNLSLHAKQVTGVDIRRAPPIRASATELPFKDQAFNLVSALGLFDYVDDKRQAAGEVRRVLRPGGHLLLELFQPVGYKTTDGIHRIFRLTEALRLFSDFRLLRQVSTVPRLSRYFMHSRRLLMGIGVAASLLRIKPSNSAVLLEAPA